VGVILQFQNDGARSKTPVQLSVTKTPDGVFQFQSPMTVLLQHGDHWLRFSNPVEVISARAPDEVFQTLEKIEQSGLWAAGFVSYEAAGAFDDALKTHAPGDLPLLQFGLFQTVEKTEIKSSGAYQLGEWNPSVSRDEYTDAIASIKEHIAAGDTYQVNYTFRLDADFEGDPFAFFCDLTAAQQGGYGAYIETDEYAICSVSPELFFELKDGIIISRPMKGTLPRGLTFSNDWKNHEALKNSAKDRAENIMIVDMIRNDIGRIAESGSVETVSRFDIEKYPTVWQMTSTVKGKTSANISNVWKNLFPCASITGAPKARTMEIIQGLERTACGHASPRGIYTGSIGFIDPDGNAQFNVAIRTAVIQAGRAEYGIGGGIVWDSDADAEYEEALSKARILARRSPVPQRSYFELLETMLWEDGKIFLQERHLKRLSESAAYFDFECDFEKIRDHLRDLKFKTSSRIRLLLSKDGTFQVECSKAYPKGSVISCADRFPPEGRVNDTTLAIAKEPVDSKDVFLYHKTTNRAVYEKAKAGFPDADDVLLYNERGEITESCIANVVVELDGKKVTPPVECGLLAGTFRDELLDRGEIEEGIVSLNDLKRADAVWLINSVRKWRSANLL
jgi:para-aminobenzoate synthetase/4-amino-4-deoxychorismate lyase